MTSAHNKKRRSKKKKKKRKDTHLNNQSRDHKVGAGSFHRSDNVNRM